VTVRISSGGAGSGTVTSSDGKVNCSACTVQYAVIVALRSRITLTATPNSTSTFAGWGGSCTGTAPTCTMGIGGNSIAIAYYRSTSKNVVAGGFHSCVLRPAGDIVCWGFNNEGEVAAVEAQGSLPVTPVPGITNAVAISAGGFHTCALIAGGTIRCWGLDAQGQLGKGSANKVPGVTSIVSGISDAIAVSAGGYHTCAIRATGGVLCWGYNSDGQIGNGNTNPQGLPQPVTIPTVFGANVGVAQISAGGFHTCALLMNGGVLCWGRNSEGELGINNTSPPGTSTVTVPVVAGSDNLGNNVPSGLLSATYIASAIGVGQQGLTQMGGFHTCGIDSTGMAVCWGWNLNGQVSGSGSGGLFDNAFPANIPLAIQYPWASDFTIPPPVLKMATGAFHSCILRSTGILCWGFNQNGELGNGTFGGDTYTVVSGTAGATDVAAGGSHTCAVLTGAAGAGSPSRVACWGYNGFGEVTGTPTSNNFSTIQILSAP